MIIENEFSVDATPARAFAVLTDIDFVAPCFPGARLTKSIDDDNYAGEVIVRLGPVQVAFAGTLNFVSRDPEQKTANLRARGKEKQGRGAADATIDMALEADGDATRVHLSTDLNLAGPVAQYGRGAGILKSVAEQVIRQFADNLQRQMAGENIGDAARPVSGAAVLGRAVVDGIKNKNKAD